MFATAATYDIVIGTVFYVLKVMIMPGNKHKVRSRSFNYFSYFLYHVGIVGVL